MAEPLTKQPERIPVNPFWLGGSLLEYCVRQGWMLKERKGRSTRYYVTPAGVAAFKQKYDIQIKMPAGQSEPDRPPQKRPPARQRAVRRAR